MVRSRNHRQTPPHLLQRLLRPPMASPHRPRLPARPGLRPRPRHLRRLPHRHHRRLQRPQTRSWPRARRRPPPLRNEVHHHTPQPMGRRPHPPRSRRRRPVRPRQPPYPLSPLPLRSHLPPSHAPQPRPPEQPLQVVSLTLTLSKKACRFSPAKCTQKPPIHHKFTTFLPSEKSHFQLPTPEETARQTEANPAITKNQPQTTTTHHKNRTNVLSTRTWSVLCY
jgi:hypothetical protein